MVKKLNPILRMQLFNLRGEDCPMIESWVSKKTKNYLSHQIQNEYLQIMALQILRQVTKKLVIVLASQLWLMSVVMLLTKNNLPYALDG